MKRKAPTVKQPKKVQLPQYSKNKRQKTSNATSSQSGSASKGGHYSVDSKGNIITLPNTKPVKPGLTNDVSGKGLDIQDWQREEDGQITPMPEDFDAEEDDGVFEQQAKKVRIDLGKKYLEKKYKEDRQKIQERKPEETLDVQEILDRENNQEDDGEEVDSMWKGIPIEPVPFNADRLKPDSTVVLFGKRREGKSFLARNILYCMRAIFTRGLIFSHTKFNMFWQNHVPERFIHAEYNPYVLQLFLDQQKELARRWAMGEQINPWAFVIMDDILEPRLRFDPVLKQLFTEGRHFKIFVLVTTQYVKGLPPTVRSNVDLAVTFRQAQLMSKEAIAEEYMSKIPKDEGMRLIDAYCKKYKDNSGQFLVVDTDDRLANSINDMFCIGKAIDPGPFLLGSVEWWGDEIDQIRKNADQKIQNIEEDLRNEYRQREKNLLKLDPRAKLALINKYCKF